MNISYKWLKTYFEEEIPKPADLADILNTHMFEVESILPCGDDSILDVKILPDRAHHDLCHRGIAREIFAVTGAKMAEKIKEDIFDSRIESLGVENVEVNIESDLCRRYMARRITGVSINESPKWLKERLECIGARSINNIVDATNFIMFDLGQPLHAFDADKIAGPITIRLAKPGEKIVLLDGREVELLETDLLIADKEGPLVIAGVKGGKRAEVTADTVNIILESANFDPVSVRRTSTRLDLRNDSSKRFENEISPELASEAMEAVCSLIKEANEDAKFGNITDIYKNVPEIKKVVCSSRFISDVVGVEIEAKDIIPILERLGMKVESRGEEMEITVPSLRLDLTIPEDIADEVGRIYGYDKLPSVLPPELPAGEKADKAFFYSEKIKNILIEMGFSEVILYSLVPKGHFEITYPLASDKAALREDLKQKMKEALILNARNAPLLDMDTVKIFEIGSIFPKEGEKASLCLGTNQVKKKKGANSQSILEEEMKSLQETIGVPFSYKIEAGEYGAVCEIDFQSIISGLPEEADINALGFAPLSRDIKYRSFSHFPFVLRDIAVWTPEGTEEKDVLDIILENAGELLVRDNLFDKFEKEGKVSYAFNLVFQSPEKTLTDIEINEIMEKITAALNVRDGWQVR